MSQVMNTESDLVVLYNGDCPICAREIAAYRRAAQAEALPIAFEDLNTADLAAWGLDRDTVRRRLHVFDRGRLCAGLPAFMALWRAIPRYRWLARLIALPGLNPVARVTYNMVLAPLLYGFDRLRRTLR